MLVLSNYHPQTDNCEELVFNVDLSSLNGSYNRTTECCIRVFLILKHLLQDKMEHYKVHIHITEVPQYSLLMRGLTSISKILTLPSS